MSCLVLFLFSQSENQAGADSSTTKTWEAGHRTPIAIEPDPKCLRLLSYLPLRDSLKSASPSPFYSSRNIIAAMIRMATKPRQSLTWMLVSSVSIEDKPSGKMKGAWWRPAASLCPAGYGAFSQPSLLAGGCWYTCLSPASGLDSARQFRRTFISQALIWRHFPSLEKEQINKRRDPPRVVPKPDVVWITSLLFLHRYRLARQSQSWTDCK